SMYASMFAFESVYLLHKSFDNATIGTVLSVTSLYAIGVQTLLANYIVKYRNVRVQDVIYAITIFIIIGSIILYFMPIDIFILALIVFMFSVSQSLLTFINSLAFIYEKFGSHINYGVARGMGSFAYAIMTIILGNIVEATTPNLLPI